MCPGTDNDEHTTALPSPSAENPFVKQRQNDQLHVCCVHEQRGPNAASATEHNCVQARERWAYQSRLRHHREANTGKSHHHRCRGCQNCSGIAMLVPHSAMHSHFHIVYSISEKWLSSKQRDRTRRRTSRWPIPVCRSLSVSLGFSLKLILLR
jgi:hypothetical protein